MSADRTAIDISEDIGVILNPGQSKDVKELITELNETYDKYCHQNFDKFSVSLVTKDNKTGLVFVGFRKEDDSELKKRLATEDDKLKRAEAAELKEYLRLKKKYEKSK